MLKMKLKTCLLLCCLCGSFFTSICIILGSLATEHHDLQALYQRPVVNEHTDIREELSMEWTWEEEEKMARKLIKELSIHRSSRPGLSNDTWRLAAAMVSPSHTFPADKMAELGHILEAMHSRRIRRADVARKGTQLKLLLTLEGDQKALFKPQWYNRSTVFEGTPYEGKDRHNGEVVAFHLSRILNMRRTPLVVGRVLDLNKEILPVATRELKKTFFTQNDSVCFLGSCVYCKSKQDAVCGEGGRLEGVVVLWLPPSLITTKFPHPWRRSYVDGKKMRWQEENKQKDYCHDVTRQSLYLHNHHQHLLYDIIDTAIFDFLIGNADRHHFEVFKKSRGADDDDDGGGGGIINNNTSTANSFLIMLDNGKSFGNPFRDEESILAPLLQCYTMRKSTAKRLNALKGGVVVRVLKAILTADPLPPPIVTHHHLIAISRRLDRVIQIISSPEISFR